MAERAPDVEAGKSHRLTTADYWSVQYGDARASRALDPAEDGGENVVCRLIDEACGPLLSTKRGGTLLEVGCGGSRWLPFLSQEYGLLAHGLDYTETGCVAARRVLEANGITGTVVNADLFDPPPEFVDHFDVIASFGVIEHFTDTSEAVRAIARLAKPGGLIMTEVPTMKGAYGALIKLFARNLFDIHHPMTASELADAHAAAGLEPLVVRYVLGLPVLLTEPPGGTNKYSTRSFAGYFSRQYLRLESTKWRVPGNRWTSPYAVCLARKPG